MLELGEVRAYRWLEPPRRRRAGRPSRRAGTRCTACSPRRSPRSWPCSTSGARSTAPTASSPTAAPTWTGCGCRRRRSGGCWPRRACSCGRCRGRAGRCASRSRTGSSYTPNSIWIYDTTHFTRAGVAVTIIEDLVTRKWITEIVSAEETSTQVQLAFTDALEREGLLDAGRRPPRTAWSTSTVDDPSPADPARRQRQRAADDLGLDPRVHGAVRDRPALRPPRHPDRPGLDRVACSATSRPSGPHLASITRPGRAARRARRRPRRTTTASGCTPASATSPPTTNTKAAAPRSARPAKPASSKPGCDGIAYHREHRQPQPTRGARRCWLIDPGSVSRTQKQVSLGLAAASSAGLGGELGWDLDHGQAAVLQGEGGLVAQAAGAFDPDAVGTMGQRPGDQVGVAGWVVGEAGLGDGPTVGSTARRQGARCGSMPMKCTGASCRLGLAARRCAHVRGPRTGRSYQATSPGMAPGRTLKWKATARPGTSLLASLPGAGEVKHAHRSAPAAASRPAAAARRRWGRSPPHLSAGRSRG